MRKRVLSLILLVSIIFCSFISPNVFADNSNSLKLVQYMDVRGKNLSAMDLRGKEDVVNTLTFDSETKWPSSDKMPLGFDPVKLLELGKDPGLGVKKLHQLGNTGKGVNVAYIDQPLLENHTEYKDSNIRYYKIRPESLNDKTVQGSSVISLLAGKDIGIVPESKVYFFGAPTWLNDQVVYAEGIRKVIEVNKTLPDDKKIKIVGFSDSIGSNKKNYKIIEKAVKEAEASGIMVFDASTLKIVGLGVKPFSDRDDPGNYELQIKSGNTGKSDNYLGVPVTGRTIAAGNKPDAFAYLNRFESNWAVPYIVGIISLGLQIDPNLTKGNAIKYLYDSAMSAKNGKIINPEGFVKLVEKNCTNKNFNLYYSDSDYYYVLYNSSRIDSADFDAIRSYSNNLEKNAKAILTDVVGYGCAADIYSYLKQDQVGRKGNLKGIQIFGTADEVPSFDIQYKIKKDNDIDTSYPGFKSDFFYSSFKNDINVIKNNFSIYKVFDEKLNVNFVPEWCVTRLPLTRGEISGFINKNNDYVSNVTKNDVIPLVSFSSPIYMEKFHYDDFGYFIKEKLDKELKVLNKSQYRLYGNKQGFYPVTTEVDGDFTIENIKNENEKGITNFFFGGHGTYHNTLQTIFENSNENSKKYIEFLSSYNINQVLSKNYYNLTTWSCSNALGLGRNTIFHEAMAKGKCVGGMGATSVIFNYGTNNNISMEKMRTNNFYFFHYAFLDSYLDGYSKSESFCMGQRAYAQEIMKNTDKMGFQNYQYNLHTLLCYHNLGLIEYWGNKHNGLVLAGEIKASNEVSFGKNIESSGIRINSIKYDVTSKEVQFTISYDIGKTMYYSFFNPPHGNILMIHDMQKGIKGKGSIVFKVPIEKLKKISSITFKLMDPSRDNNDFVSFKTDQIYY